MIKQSGPQILRDDEKTLLLELSKEYKDYSCFSFLCDLKSEMVINWPDLTPLITAIVDEEDFAVATSLYFVHIKEIAQQIRKGKTEKVDKPEIYILVYTSEMWTESVLVSQIVLKLKERDLNSERIGRILSKFDCSNTTLIHLEDLEIIRAYLPLIKPRETIQDSKSFFRLLVKNADPRYLQLFLQHKTNLLEGAYDFFESLISNIRELHSHEAGRAFIKTSLQIDFFRETTFHALERALMRSAKENLELFLEHDYQSFVKSTLDKQDIMACVFGNRDPKVLEILKSMKIDLNARGSVNRSSMHFAAENNATENIRYLISRGADPNVRDRCSRTPFNSVLSNRGSRDVADEECIKALLIGGADILYKYNINKHSKSFFNIDVYQLRRETRLYPNIINILLAQLAICETLGLSVEEPMKDYIFLQQGGYGNDNFYGNCKEQLEQLKVHNFRETHKYCQHKFTMFVLISQRKDCIARYINEEDLKIINGFMEKYKREESLIPFYYESLENHIKIIDRISKFISATKSVLAECMCIADVNHLIIHEIIGYLTIRDFLI